jgi:hypothetical protein
MVMVIHELTGINAILLYSNTIIGDIPGLTITPRQGTYLVGIFNFLAALCALWTGKAFSRRALFITGHFAMGVCHFGIATCLLLGLPWGSLISMFLFLFAF